MDEEPFTPFPSGVASPPRLSMPCAAVSDHDLDRGFARTSLDEIKFAVVEASGAMSFQN